MKGFYRRAAMEARPADLTGLENAVVMQLPDGDFWTRIPAPQMFPAGALNSYKVAYIGSQQGG